LEKEGTQTQEEQCLEDKCPEESERPSLSKNDGVSNTEREGNDEPVKPLKKADPRKRMSTEADKALRKHADAFAWTPADMTGKVVNKEVEEWLKFEIVKRVRYPSWVANPILVKKADDSWRICINFKDLNTACPKDLYPLPKIDWKIESLMGFKYNCFLDAYKGYHHIQMSRKDEEQMAFHTDEIVFCYTKMPFELKNAKATYQRLVDTIFEGQIGRNLEAYVDDMVIKSKMEQDLTQDVKETLLTLKKVNMKLNPKKCSFRMEEGKFLGYIVTSEVIRANLEKTKVVMSMPGNGYPRKGQKIEYKMTKPSTRTERP
ncbi:reverse transcriptase domain-containing protein, partial [Tanacetum coccineum]